MFIAKCGVQMLNVFNQHIEVPFGNCHGEKIRTAREAVASIVGHRTLPDVTEDDMESDGLRYAVPIRRLYQSNVCSTVWEGDGLRYAPPILRFDRVNSRYPVRDYPNSFAIIC